MKFGFLSLASGLLLVSSACGSSSSDIECTRDSDCNLADNGSCVSVCSGSQWCLYEDTSCSSGSRWSDFRTGDGLSDECFVGEQICAAGDADGGSDAMADASEALCEPLIAFVGTKDGNQEIYVARPNGSGLLNLTNSPEREENPRWSPDGTKLIFDRVDMGTGRDDLWVINADGTGIRNLTQSPATSDFGGVWAPNGTKIVFTRGESIFTVGIDGLNLTPVVDDGAINLSPSWSPNQSKIAYRNATREVRVVNANGTNNRLIATGTQPVYSPANDAVMFLAPEIFGDINVVDDGGVSAANLTNTGDSVEQQGAWSKDGEKIAWVSFRDGNFEIYSMDADGSGPINLTSDAGSDRLPTWSGDGSKITWESGRDGGSRIWVMDANGQNAQRLTTDNASELAPQFSPCEP